MKMPKWENVWGTIQTKSGCKYIITFDVNKNRYYLYCKTKSHYNKMLSSKEPIELLKKIQKYENN
ncbi:hypothetical protein [uncultured Clostridium sp.]|uniref:hypothetical protein n=1 Tax=uncultured Clostridium sp. TaxID=59620 RepID=UPI00272B87C7|nr:hypothetical protein [uncultured Clostridium sp.]